MKTNPVWLLVFMGALVAPPAEGQFWKKIKDAAAEAVEKESAEAVQELVEKTAECAAGAAACIEQEHNGDAPGPAPAMGAAQQPLATVAVQATAPAGAGQPDDPAPRSLEVIMSDIEARPPAEREKLLARYQVELGICEGDHSTKQFRDCECFARGRMEGWLVTGIENIDTVGRLEGDRSMSHTCWSRPKITAYYRDRCRREGPPPSADDLPEDPLERWRRIQEQRQAQAAGQAGTEASPPDPETKALCGCIADYAAQNFHTLRSTYSKDLDHLYGRGAEHCRAE